MLGMDLLEKIFRYSKPSATLDIHQMDDIKKLSEIIRAYLLDRYRRQVASCESRPLLFQYSCDSTPLSTKERLTSCIDMWKVIRRGRVSSHFLVERAFCSDIQGNTTVVFDEPLQMLDSTAWSHYSAARRLLPLPRELGHQALCITHHVWDRAIQSALERHHQQLHIALEEHQSTRLSEGETFKMLCTTFNTAVGCCLHDCHNAFKWSIAVYIQDPVVMQRLDLLRVVAKFLCPSRKLCRGLDWIAHCIRGLEQSF